MGKRGNGEGSIGRRKSGGWYAQYTVYTSEGRKRRTLYGKTRQEVATKLSKALADREGGQTFDAGSLTVGEYLTRWLSHSVQDTVSQKTYERYESIVRVHLSPIDLLPKTWSSYYESPTAPDGRKEDSLWANDTYRSRSCASSARRRQS